MRGHYRFLRRRLAPTEELAFGERGQALVEMALVMTVLLTLILGAMEFGRIFNAYLVVTHAAREGARYGVVGADDGEIVEVIKRASAPLDPSLLTITIYPRREERYRGVPLTVEVRYPVDIVAPVFSGILPDPFVVKGKTVMRVES